MTNPSFRYAAMRAEGGVFLWQNWYLSCGLQGELQVRQNRHGAELRGHQCVGCAAKAIHGRLLFLTGSFSILVPAEQGFSIDKRADPLHLLI